MCKKRTWKCLTAAHLKLIAMACMLLDHLWGTVVPGNQWMNCVGRLAFPIFAFQVAEGYCRTGNFKRYLKRMFLFALAAEIPYNLMLGGALFHPLGQNVMLTFCLSLLLLRAVDAAWKKNPFLGAGAAVLGGVIGYFVGMFTFVDYYGYGILMVLAFWLFREKRWWNPILLLAVMAYINVGMIRGLSFVVEGFGWEWFVPVQSFAVLALIPIFLYNGEQGWKSRRFQYACYAFYPVHMLILVLVAILL